MVIPPDQTAQLGVNIEHYVKNVQPEDLPLLADAAAAAKVGALRGAYILVWLACAESLKRRFREAQPRDDEAGKIVGQFEAMEQRHEAVDKFLLDKALEYGFVSNSEHAHLSHVYANRCIYGHPYEEVPSPEKLVDATATVVELVLSRPVKLRHGFGKRLLEDLLAATNFLDDQETAVTAFAKDILPRIDEAIYGWFLGQYIARLESISDDASMAIFFRRGLWFAKGMLMEVGTDVLSQDDWHGRTVDFPKTMMGVCSDATIFAQIGSRAQDTLVGAIIEDSKTYAKSLAYLEPLYNNSVLSQRQRERYETRMGDLSIDEARIAQLDIRLSFPTIVNELKSGDFQAQNSSVGLLRSLGPTQAALLDERQQETLGRSILLAAEMNAWSAIRFLRVLSTEARDWPIGVIRGTVLESFADEEGDKRLYVRFLHLVAAAIDQFDAGSRTELINAAMGNIEANRGGWQRTSGQPKEVIETLRMYPWAEPLMQMLPHQEVDYR